jgi:hypothetical protein
MNIIPQFAIPGASLLVAKYRIDTIVQKQTIAHSLRYMLGRNQLGCLPMHSYKYYPNYSEYQIKERLRIFIEAVFRKNNTTNLVSYLALKSDDELVKAILSSATIPSVEGLYKFLNAEKRRG